MSYPQQPYQQQPGGWQDPSWPVPDQGYANQNQGYTDPNYGAAYGSPAGAYPGYPASAPPVASYGYGGPLIAQRRTNGLAVASLVVSIVSLLILMGAPGIVGAIMGHIARGQIRRTGDDGEGMALAGIIIGWIGFAIAVIIVAFVVFVILAASTVPDGSSSSWD